MSVWASADASRLREYYSRYSRHVLLHVPQGALPRTDCGAKGSPVSRMNCELGVDVMSHTVSFGSDFSLYYGVKLIPCGVHVLLHRIKGSVVTGVEFLHLEESKISESEVIIREWNASLEAFVEMVDAEQAGRIARGVRNFEFDGVMMPYDMSGLDRWRKLSKYISKEVLDHVGWNNFQSQFRYSALNKVLEDAKNMDSIQRTVQHMDKSFIVQHAANLNYSGDISCLVGELQHAFVCLICGEIWQAFEQWKKLIVILSECENLLLSHPEFCAAFIDTLAIHVEELPDDLSMFHSLEENVVIHSFNNLCEILGPGHDSLSHLQSQIERKFQISLNEFTCPEDSPVIVDEYASVYF